VAPATKGRRDISRATRPRPRVVSCSRLLFRRRSHDQGGQSRCSGRTGALDPPGTTSRDRPAMPASPPAVSESRRRRAKRSIACTSEKYVANPQMRAALTRGLAPSAYALLETTGRRTGRIRRIPVANGLDGDSFWLISAHGDHSHYVHNLQAHPRVRIGLRAGAVPCAGGRARPTPCPTTTPAPASAGWAAADSLTGSKARRSATACARDRPPDNQDGSRPAPTPLNGPNAATVRWDRGVRLARVAGRFEPCWRPGFSALDVDVGEPA
jgi:deazaflavin-dependent oxidoreductase (nitroreductase family)